MIYLLVLANALVFMLSKYGHVSTSALYLNHQHAAWYQLVTSTFCHANIQHLSGNLFPMLVFGRLVEEELGGFGLLVAYLVCGVCSNLASLFLLSATTMSLGASGAVFGLFTVAVMSRLSVRYFSWRSMIEAVVFGYFVWERLISEVAVTSAGGIIGVNHVAHLAGAGAGVALVLGIKVLLAMLERGESSARA